MNYLVLGVEYYTLEEIADTYGVTTSTIHRWLNTGELEYKAGLIRAGKYRKKRTITDAPIAKGVQTSINGAPYFKSITAAAKHYKISRQALTDVINSGIRQIVVKQEERS